MDNSEWLTIRDFAEQAHVSRQAVYQRIKGLEQYTRQSVNENGKPITLVNTAALAFFDRGNSSQVVSQFQVGNDKLVDVLTAEIERLRADNDRMADEKSALYATIKEKDQQLYDLAARFADLAQQAQQLTAQAQTLHAADKPRLMAASSEIEQDGDTAPEPPETPQDGSEGEGVQGHSQGEERPAEGKKRGRFWAWLMG